MVGPIPFCFFLSRDRFPLDLPTVFGSAFFQVSLVLSTHCGLYGLGIKSLVRSIPDNAHYACTFVALPSCSGLPISTGAPDDQGATRQRQNRIGSEDPRQLPRESHGGRGLPDGPYLRHEG